MIILKRWKDNEKWFQTSIEECIEHTEGSGYWKKGSVVTMLEEGLNIQTPCAIYRINKK